MRTINVQVEITTCNLSNLKLYSTPICTHKLQTIERNLTWKMMGTPSTNSMRHMQAVKAIFLFLRKAGYSSMKAEVMVSNIPNCERKRKIEKLIRINLGISKLTFLNIFVISSTNISHLNCQYRIHPL